MYGGEREREVKRERKKGKYEEKRGERDIMKR